jgi:hypothetical protein
MIEDLFRTISLVIFASEGDVDEILAGCQAYAAFQKAATVSKFVPALQASSRIGAGGSAVVRKDRMCLTFYRAPGPPLCRQGLVDNCLGHVRGDEGRDTQWCACRSLRLTLMWWPRSLLAKHTSRCVGDK